MDENTLQSVMMLLDPVTLNELFHTALVDYLFEDADTGAAIAKAAMNELKQHGIHGMEITLVDPDGNEKP